MTVPTDSPRRGVLHEPRRAGRELLLEGVFRPLANAVVPLLVRAKVAPPVVVVANATLGLLAAAAIGRGELLLAAVLLQGKTLLDNADGQLARATGRVTLAGRYLDTLADLVVNAAVFVALGDATGRPVLAAAAFVALTLVLAADFNVTELYREANGIAVSQPRSTQRASERALGQLYDVTLGPLDRWIRGFADRRGVVYDTVAVTLLANLGLTTQLAVLGLCLALGAPALYLWIAIGCLVLLVPVHLRAERLGARTTA